MLVFVLAVANFEAANIKMENAGSIMLLIAIFQALIWCSYISVSRRINITLNQRVRSTDPFLVQIHPEPVTTTSTLTVPTLASDAEQSAVEAEELLSTTTSINPPKIDPTVAPDAESEKPGGWIRGLGGTGTFPLLMGLVALGGLLLFPPWLYRVGSRAVARGHAFIFDQKVQFFSIDFDRLVVLGGVILIVTAISFIIDKRRP